MSETKKGLESLKKAVMKDCQNAENCFSENGCTKERYAIVPENNIELYKMGFTTKCIAKTKCTHDYCGKYKWVLDRAQHYADKTGKTVDEILSVWENDRTYWYMSYYQEINQPLLNDATILMKEDWELELKKRFGNDPKKWAFKCPNCGNVQTIQDFIDNGIENFEKVYSNCIGRYVKDKGCDWTLGGLLKIHTVAVMKDALIFPVFEMAEKPTNPKQHTTKRSKK